VDRQVIVAWLQVLDDLTYYAMFGVPQDASPDELKDAFHVFADTFHPDVHSGRPEDERDAIGRIFRRGTEAYRVLTDPALRAQYDASLAEGEPPSVVSRRLSLPPAPSRPVTPKKLADTIKSPQARPLVIRGEELAKKGDFKQAKLQLSLARNYEPDNEALAQLLKDVEAKAKAQK
jgi:curved DNA-binding protein CbpA